MTTLVAYLSWVDFDFDFPLSTGESDENLAELAGQVGMMMEHLNQTKVGDHQSHPVLLRYAMLQIFPYGNHATNAASSGAATAGAGFAALAELVATRGDPRT